VPWFRVSPGLSARWRNGKVVEDYLFYDSATFMKQIGLGRELPAVRDSLTRFLQEALERMPDPVAVYRRLSREHEAILMAVRAVTASGRRR